MIHYFWPVCSLLTRHRLDGIFPCVWLHLFYAITSQQLFYFHTTKIPHFFCCAGSSVIVPKLRLLLFLKLVLCLQRLCLLLSFASTAKSQGNDMLEIDMLNKHKQKWDRMPLYGRKQ